jgi:hypothetical protein
MIAALEQVEAGEKGMTVSHRVAVRKELGPEALNMGDKTLARRYLQKVKSGELAVKSLSSLWLFRSTKSQGVQRGA